ncbi:unnamed protein product [Spirodela intermedia]|uniref:AAA+ ATPase domain-containing protein n=1 Tax=Spirodela intermedia TaxID=51605 RepID=A0A7I8KSZ8_SPIIN|nr:unnamed protein product [Spirodela intermedia]
MTSLVGGKLSKKTKLNHIIAIYVYSVELDFMHHFLRDPQIRYIRSDFFQKVSEKKLKHKHQMEQEDVMETTGDGSINLLISGFCELTAENCCWLIHPFFSRWKTKKVSEFSLISKLNKSYNSAPEEDLVACGRPIHVSVMLQDDISPLDWGRWEINERSLLNLSEYVSPESNLLSVSDVSNAPLTFDGVIPFLNVCGDILRHRNVHSDQLPEEDTQVDISNRIMLSIRKQIRRQKIVVPYQLHHLTDGCLWTNKYQPGKGVEVCGNNEAVKFLVEWLASWHERCLQEAKGRTSKTICIDEDSDESLYENDSDSENDEASRRNVLLVTGPVGCGKTAAIYACAKELGFHVIEVNASDVRNGAHIKQKFGEAMDSQAIELCSVEEIAGLNKKDGLPFIKSSTNPEAIASKDGDLKQALTLCESTNIKCPGNSFENQSSTCRVANRNLFLFEDMDAIFHEDRGLITTIMQLAETSKRPIILTTNSKYPNLPHALDKVVVAFTRPSTEELLACICLICSAEGAHVSPRLLEQLINTCQGDIRKTILLLQFWCQGEKGRPDRNMQLTYSPLQFDLDAAHWVIESFLPWSFPCELSLKVEEEISNTVSSLLENQGIIHSFTKEDITVSIDTPRNIATGTGEDAMMKNVCPSFQYNESSTPINDSMGFSDALGSLLTSPDGSFKHKSGTILSSESADLYASDTNLDINTHVMRFPQPMEDANCTNSCADLFVESAALSSDSFMIDKIASSSHVCNTYTSTCTPELSVVPETEISNRDGFPSTTVNSPDFSSRLVDFSLNNSGSELPVSQEDVDHVEESILVADEDPMSKFANIDELDRESVHGNEEPDASQIEGDVGLSRGYQIMDECSCAGFSLELMPVDRSLSHPIIHSVNEKWKKLRSCQEDLRLHMTSAQKDALNILDLTSGLTNLISDADILLGRCQLLTSDVLELSETPHDELCSSSWYDEHLEMASTFSQHGLCLYASKAMRSPSTLRHENPLHLAQEMLAANTCSMALGKRLSLKNTLKLESKLCNALRPIIPTRSLMTLQSQALHEYASSLSLISKTENSRLSGGKDHPRSHRRAQASRHYLSSLPGALTPEDVELFAGYGCFGSLDFR